MPEPTAVTPEAASDEAIEAATWAMLQHLGYEAWPDDEVDTDDARAVASAALAAALPVERAAWERQVREQIADAGIAVADYLRGLDYATTMSSLAMRHGEEIATVVFDAALVGGSLEGGKR